jgi:cyclophilin family peptidyl-prolyl cis-trans isomerase
MKPIRLALALFLAAAVAALAQGSTQGTTAGTTSTNPRVTLETSKGKIVIELFPDKAPKSTANFLKYVQSGHYNGTIFHRVIPGFMAQAGGFTPNMAEKPTKAPIPNESSNGLSNDRGTVAMARTSDPNSATAQFFINVKDNAPLNFRAPNGWGYAVFGKVVEGMDVVDAIVAVPTTTKGVYENVPQEPILIKKATVVGKAPAPKSAGTKKPAPKKSTKKK